MKTAHTINHWIDIAKILFLRLFHFFSRFILPFYHHHHTVEYDYKKILRFWTCRRKGSWTFFNFYQYFLFLQLFHTDRAVKGGNSVRKFAYRAHNYTFEYKMRFLLSEAVSRSQVLCKQCCKSIQYSSKSERE